MPRRLKIPPSQKKNPHRRKCKLVIQRKASGILTGWPDEKRRCLKRISCRDNKEERGSTGMAGTADTRRGRGHCVDKRNFRLSWAFQTHVHTTARQEESPFHRRTKKALCCNRTKSPQQVREHAHIFKGSTPLLIFSNKAYHHQSLSDPPHSQ